METPFGDAVVSGMPARFGKQSATGPANPKMYYDVTQGSGENNAIVKIYNTSLGDCEFAIELSSLAGVRMSRPGVDANNFHPADILKPEVIIQWSGGKVTSVSWAGIQVRAGQ
jgi:hypothetical protein